MRIRVRELVQGSFAERAASHGKPITWDEIREGGYEVPEVIDVQHGWLPHMGHVYISAHTDSEPISMVATNYDSSD
tara:strand:+ start:541 stop:768 length:228 start_codon:yes stop_codon:yes gene_type:complete